LNCWAKCRYSNVKCAGTLSTKFTLKDLRKFCSFILGSLYLTKLLTLIFQKYYWDLVAFLEKYTQTPHACKKNYLPIQGLLFLWRHFGIFESGTSLIITTKKYFCTYQRKKIIHWIIRLKDVKTWRTNMFQTIPADYRFLYLITHIQITACSLYDTVVIS